MSHVILSSPLTATEWVRHFSGLKEQHPCYKSLWQATQSSDWLIEVATPQEAYYLHVEFQPGNRIVIAAEVVSSPPPTAVVAKHLLPLLQWWLKLSPATHIQSHTLGHHLSQRALSE